jgi:predicted DNA-binding transcriptional regulator AlpA
MQQASTTENRLLRLPEVAEQLDQRTSTIQTWCRTYKLPHIRLSARNFRVRQSDLAESLKSLRGCATR